MSYSVDVNLLLYASDRSCRQHEVAVRFLRRCITDPDIFFLFWPTVFGYLRIATHPRIFAHPLAPAEALGNMESLLGLPRVRAVPEGEDFLECYREVCHHQTVRGNFVPDAHLAALMRQNGVRTLYTADSDFRKFEFLDVRNPLGV